MWDRYIREERIVLERILAQKCYWWTLFDANLIAHIKGIFIGIKLPLPRLVGRGSFADPYRRKKYNEEQILKARKIWEEFIQIMQEKMERVNSGQTTVEEEFKDGIFFEEGRYGLKYKEDWPL